MGWTTPATWTDGMVVHDTDLNTQIKGNMDYLKAIPERGTITSDGSGEATITFAGSYLKSAGKPICLLQTHDTLYGIPFAAGIASWADNGTHYTSVTIKTTDLATPSLAASVPVFYAVFPVS